MLQEQSWQGSVAERIIETGSKSDRVAVVLVSEGQEYFLRRMGEFAFEDTTLQGLVGRRLKCRAVQHGSTLIMTDYTVLS